MELFLEIIKYVLMFFQDTNTLIAFIALFISFLTLKQRKNALVRCLVLIAYLILTNNIIGIVNFLNKYLVIGYIHFGYLLYFALLVLIIWFIFDECFPRILFISTIAYLIENTIYQFGNIIYLVFFDSSNQIAEYNSSKPILFLIIYEFLIVVVTILIYYLLTKKSKKEYIFKISNLSIVLIESLVIFIIVFLNYYGTMGKYMNLITRVYAFLIDLFIIMFEISFLNENNLKYENKVINAMFAMQEKQYLTSKTNEEKLNIIIHDIKRQIRVLSALGDENDKNKAISEMKEVIAVHETNIHTGNDALDLILSEKSYECNKEKISFSSVADGKAIEFMTNSDIYILFSNALDNAIERLVKEEESKRVLSVLVTKNCDCSIIEIINYCSTNIDFKNSIPITSKQNKELHGFGIKSIVNIVNKYGGLYKISLEENAFKLKIVIENSVNS